MENKVLAKVDGKEITQADFDFMRSSLSPQIAQQFIGPEGEKHLLNELISQKLLFLDALDKKYNEEPTFKEELAKMEENLLTQYSVRKIIDSVKISDEDAKEFYNSNPELFVSPEQIRASHILIEDEELANKLYEDISSGEDFALVAADNSTCPSAASGGDLNYFSRGQMVPEFEEVAFEMALDEVSKPVTTQFGYHIIKLTDKKDSETHDFDAVKPNIVQNLGAQKQQEMYINYIENLKSGHNIEILG